MSNKYWKSLALGPVERILLDWKLNSPPLDQIRGKEGPESIDDLKGVWHEIFELRFFPWISVPQANKYSTGAVLNFFENSRRYSRILMFIAGVNDTGEKLFSGVNDTGDKFLIVDAGQK